MTQVETVNKSSRFKLLKVYNSITSTLLKEEIQRRKIPYNLADQYLKQAFVMDRKSQRKYIALAFENSLSSFEISIPFAGTGSSFRASIPSNSYTLIEGIDLNHVQVFKCFWDFLTWLTMNQDTCPKSNSYILNGSKTVENVIESIRIRESTKSVIDFLGNDDSDERLRVKLADGMEELNIRYGSQNYLYRTFKDLSEYWITCPDASNIWPVKPIECSN